MADSKADFTVNNYDVFEYQEGEIYIQTDLGEKMCTDQIRVNQGRVYLRIVDLQRLLKFALDSHFATLLQERNDDLRRHD